MTQEELINKIRVLESELEKRVRENHSLLDKIEHLEDTVIRLESLIPEEDMKKKSKKKQTAESRLAYELEEKVNEIRDLKNRMGFLRKDYTQLQEKYEKLEASMKETSVIRVEDFREKSPLNILVKDLQEKVNKQKSLISQLGLEVESTSEFHEKLKEKEDIIEVYKLEISDLNQKLQDLSTTSENKGSDSVAKKLIEDLQNQLNKSKRQVLDLKQKLDKYEKKSKKEDKKATTSKINELKEKLKEANGQLDTKNIEIETLKKEIISLKANEIKPDLDQVDGASSEMINILKKDLQQKLNKAKIQIKSLQGELTRYKKGDISDTGEPTKEIEGKLKMQRDMAMFLQKQLKTKEEEIETIKNEAVQIKKRYRQLENELKTRDIKLNDLQKQMETPSTLTRTPSQEDPDLALRLRELKGIIEDLKKQTIEQSIEIANLRKK
ncbi:MAG: hypothetical protein ACFFEN_06255 [Candidatus Thorarchaeota archaeon]